MAGRWTTVALGVLGALGTGLLACSSADPSLPGPSGGAFPDATGGASGGQVGSGGLMGSSGGTAGSPQTSSWIEARVWRLRHEQYRNSVVALLGVEPDLTNFAPESGNGKYANFSSTAFVQVDLAANYYTAAKSISSALPASVLTSLTSCSLGPSCKDSFIAELGERAFRSPVPSEVMARLGALFELASGEADAESGFRAVLAAILNSPLFLYRKELGPEDGAEEAEPTLTGYQIAEFLSFSLLDAPPPAWLLELAKNSTLGEAQLESSVTRLLDESAFSEQLGHFLEEWLEVAHFSEVEKSEVFPGFAAAKPLMAQELTTFLAQSGNAERGLRNLLLDPVPSVAPELDDFYFSDPSAPASFERNGILGLGSVLASHAKTYLTSPTLRGKFVRSRLFCREITLPEGFTPPPISETEALGVAQSTRQLYEKHQESPICATCHELTDYIGYALEAYDGAGRVRTLDTTQGFEVPIDTSGPLLESDVDRLLTDDKSLSLALSESPTVKGCLARQAFRYFFGLEEQAGDVPAIASGQQRLLAQDQLKELTLGLLTTPTTTRRVRGEN